MNVPVAADVAFDESGNTGDNLLDETQPVCVLASIHIPEADARALVDEVLPDGRSELHFAPFRRSQEGRTAILAVLNSAVLQAADVRVTPMHKPFAVVARFFDYVIEPTIYARGHDVIATDMQLDFVNVLYRRGPSACGNDLWSALLRSFVQLVRSPDDDQSLEAFMEAHRACLIAASHPLIRFMLEDVPERDEVARRVRIDQPADIGMRDLLDPVPTMLVESCMVWPQRLGRPIRVVHDESNVVRRWTPLISALSEPNADAVVGRYWAQLMPLPLQVASVELVRSHDSPPVQLADIVGGATVTWLTAQAQPGGQWEQFARQIGETALPAWIENEVWPMPTTPFSRFR